MNRHSALGALLALTVAIGIFGEAAAATPPCAEDINGSGKAIELPTLLSEPQRIALSTVVFEALQPPQSGDLLAMAPSPAPDRL